MAHTQKKNTCTGNTVEQIDFIISSPGKTISMELANYDTVSGCACTWFWILRFARNMSKVDYGNIEVVSAMSTGGL